MKGLLRAMEHLERCEVCGSHVPAWELQEFPGVGKGKMCTACHDEVLDDEHEAERGGSRDYAADMKHDLSRQDEIDATGPTSDGLDESTEFDRFMDSTVLSERRLIKVEVPDTAQRIMERRYRDRPMNKVRIGGK